MVKLDKAYTEDTKKIMGLGMSEQDINLRLDIIKALNNVISFNFKQNDQIEKALAVAGREDFKIKFVSEGVKAVVRMAAQDSHPNFAVTIKDLLQENLIYHQLRIEKALVFLSKMGSPGCNLEKLRKEIYDKFLHKIEHYLEKGK